MTQISFRGDRGSDWIYDDSLRIDEDDPGSSSRVYEGFSTDGSPVAVKVLPGVFQFAPGILGREKDIADKLEGLDADGLIRTRDTARLGEDLLLVMDRAERSLADYLREQQSLSEDEAIEVLRQIALGLTELHQASVIHRDLKPQNVLLHEGSWKLADFGIARDAEIGTQSSTYLGLGSKPYMAPETWRGLSPSFKTDLYSLGCMAHELLTGQKLWAGPNDAEYEDQHLREEPPTRPTASAGLERLIRRLLMKEPARRPQDARDVKEALERLLEPDLPVNPRLVELALLHAEELSREDAEESVVAERLARRKALLEQSREDLEDVLREGVRRVAAAVDDVEFEWTGLPEIRSPIATLLFTNLNPFNSGLDDDTAVAYGELFAKNRRGVDGAQVGDVVYEEVEAGRFAWVVYRFSKQGFVPGTDYHFGPHDRAHGMGLMAFTEERRTILSNQTTVYRVRRYELTADEVEYLFGVALELEKQ